MCLSVSKKYASYSVLFDPFAPVNVNHVIIDLLFRDELIISPTTLIEAGADCRRTIAIYIYIASSEEFSGMAIYYISVHCSFRVSA